MPLRFPFVTVITKKTRTRLLPSANGGRDVTHVRRFDPALDIYFVFLLVRMVTKAVSFLGSKPKTREPEEGLIPEAFRHSNSC